MIIHVFIVSFCILTIETIFYLQFFKKCKICVSTTKKISNTIFSKNISDHWKEKSLLKYSQILLFHSLKLLGILLIVIMFYFVISYLYQPFSMYLISVIGILETTVIVFVYVYFRKLIDAKL